MLVIQHALLAKTNGWWNFMTPSSTGRVNHKTKIETRGGLIPPPSRGLAWPIAVCSAGSAWRYLQKLVRADCKPCGALPEAKTSRMVFTTKWRPLADNLLVFATLKIIDSESRCYVVDCSGSAVWLFSCASVSSSSNGTSISSNSRRRSMLGDTSKRAYAHRQTCAPRPNWRHRGGREGHS